MRFAGKTISHETGFLSKSTRVCPILQTDSFLERNKDAFFSHKTEKQSKDTPENWPFTNMEITKYTILEVQGPPSPNF